MNVGWIFGLNSTGARFSDGNITDQSTENLFTLIFLCQLTIYRPEFAKAIVFQSFFKTGEVLGRAIADTPSDWSDM